MSSATHLLTPNTQAILLLCGRFGKASDSGPKPLSAAEYDRLAQWLQGRSLRPADLLDPAWPGDDADTSLPISIARILDLLDRGAALALAVESWSNKGLWVLGRSDDNYPKRLKSRLGRLAPPLLYGFGAPALLAGGGLAIVGSRDADDRALEATRRIASACAQQRIAVISGGARGVDSEAMLAAIDAGGCAVGILADSLARTALTGKYRRALLAGQLALVSPYDPESGFNVGNAMGRNKDIYALADWGLVINAAFEEGGTWAGAIEALKQQLASVFVWVGATPSVGNAALMARGARRFPSEPWHDLPSALSSTEPVQSVLRPQQPALAHASETSSLADQPLARDSPPSSDHGAVPESILTAPNQEPQAMPTTTNVFAAVLPVLLPHLEQPRDLDTLAEQLSVRRSQLQDWLDRAVAEGRVTKLTRPVRYAAVRHEQAVLAPPS